MWIVAGFAALGLLIGSLVGFTAHSVVTSVLTLVFAFTGGSVITFLGKLGQEDRRLAGQAIFSLSLFCLLGTYSGIAVSEWHLLSPHQTTESQNSAGTKANDNQPVALRNKYLDYLPVSKINAIDIRYRNGDLKDKPKEAYELLYATLNEDAPQNQPQK